MRPRWHELEEFPDYAVNDLGEVHNIKTGMPRKTSVNQHDIVKISLYKHGKELHTRSVAVLTAEAFCEGKSDHFNTPLHLDGDRENCRADNLLWRPRWFVIAYHRQFYIEAFHAMTVHIQELTTGKEYYDVKTACVELGLYFEDVYRSYAEGVRVPMTGHIFQLIDEEGGI